MDEKKTPVPPPFKPNNRNNFNGKNNTIFWIFAIATLCIIMFQFYNPAGSPQNIYWEDVETMLKNQDIKRIVVVNKEKHTLY